MCAIAVVGAGPTGIYALKHLLREPTPQRITIFEASARPGPGTPYDSRANAPELLANIASYELPPVVDSLAAWLARLPAEARRRLGVRGPVGERVFYPRLALGAYFVAQLRALLRLGRKAGHAVVVRAAARVADVKGLPEGARVSYFDRRERLREERFDYVLVATGHRARPARTAALTLPAYPAPKLRKRGPLHAAVLGASLTAIDAALALALQRGEFRGHGEALAYFAHDGEAPLRIEMLSRQGVLPETDFYFPYPHEPLRHCTPGALQAIGADAAPAKLDRAFALLAEEIRAEDPAFARRIGLEGLTADSFAAAYFAARSSGDAFADLARNLREAEAGAGLRQVSRWRYALLRAHEAFAELTPQLDAADLARFGRGLRRVFADNYAALPPLSARRLLALHAAGVLGSRRVAPGYALQTGAAGKVAVIDADGARNYDFVVDARGERAALARELPFPTLRLQALANLLFEAGDEGSLALGAALRLRQGANPVDRVYCLAAPFLLSRRPFVQGLTSAHDLAARVVADVLARGPSGAGEAEDAAPVFRPGGGLLLGDGLVVASPAPGGGANALFPIFP